MSDGPEPVIEITPEMIEAGVVTLARYAGEEPLGGYVFVDIVEEILQSALAKTCTAGSEKD